MKSTVITVNHRADNLRSHSPERIPSGRRLGPSQPARSQRGLWVLLLGALWFSAFSALSLGGTAYSDYDLYVTNGTGYEFTLTYVDPTRNPPQTTTIGSVTASNHNLKFSNFATNGETSVEITARSIANPADVRTFWARRRGMDYWLEIN